MIDQAVERRATRLSFLLRADLVVPGIASLPCRVRDLSSGGMKLQLDDSDERVVVGSLVETTLPGAGSVSGCVVWRRGGFLGVRFNRDIDPRQARLPVGRSTSTPDFVKPVLVPSRRLNYVEGL